MLARFTLGGLTALMLAAPAFAQDQPVEPGFVYGWVRDAAGQPLGGAIVYMDGAYDQNHQQTVKDDGTYRIRLTAGAYKPMAWIHKKWEGQTFKIDLEPSSTDTLNDTDGAVVNFTWRVSGEKPAPEMGSYGGFIYVNVGTDHTFIEDQDNITYTLTPVGTIIDGSTIEPIVRRGGAPRTQEWGKLLDVPVGRYVITGIYAPPGKKPQTLRFANAWARGEKTFSDSLEFVMQAEGNYCSNCASVDVESLKEAEPE